MFLSLLHAARLLWLNFFLFLFMIFVEAHSIETMTAIMSAGFNSRRQADAGEIIEDEPKLLIRNVLFVQRRVD